MRKLFLASVALTLFYPAYSHAQQHSYGGSTAADVAEEQNACFLDAQKFCGGNDIFVFEMETCLANHVAQLSKGCRKQIAPTNFKKYYTEEAHPFGF
jgi:hypothetical protein